jgi:FkbM family methyltransferase
LQTWGLDLVRYKPEYSPQYSLVKLLDTFKINTFIDVGANTGQTGKSLRDNSFDGTILSFEPTSKAFSVLEKNAKKYSDWKTFNYALGDRDGDIKINVSQNLQSSSILPMLPIHSNADPATKYISNEKTKIFKLDTIWPKFIKKKGRVFLKLDTQGYEDKILKGAKKSIKNIDGIQLEMSLVPLYRGEKTYKEMLKKLDAQGLQLYQLYPGFTDPSSGRLLQLDGVFFKKSPYKSIPKAKL